MFIRALFFVLCFDVRNSLLKSVAAFIHTRYKKPRLKALSKAKAIADCLVSDRKAPYAES